jgi:hypothetical protein
MFQRIEEASSDLEMTAIVQRTVVRLLGRITETQHPEIHNGDD